MENLVHLQANALIKVIGLDVVDKPRDRLIWQSLTSPSRTHAGGTTYQQSSQPRAQPTPQAQAQGPQSPPPTPPRQHQAFRAPGRISLRYELVGDASLVFPKRKERAERKLGITEEDYEPPGIFKANWMVKHAQTIPAAVVVFFELEWQAEDWSERLKECASLLAQIRAGQCGRSSRIVAILQQTVPQNDVPMEVKQQRAQELRSGCSLHTRTSLYTLDAPDDRLDVSVSKLEHVFVDLANQHYNDEIQRVMHHVGIANQQTEFMILLRYHIKIGFFHELRGEAPAAISSYDTAIKFLLQLDKTPNRVHEINFVGSVIVLRVCRLLFPKKPLEALDRFKHHLRSQRPKPTQMTAAHHEWLSDTFSIFAQLFEMACQGGLDPVTTEHPGLYFYFAAQHAQSRQRMAKYSLKPQEHKPLVRMDTLYIGVYTTCVQGELEPVAPEQRTTLAQLYERQYNHSAAIIDLLERAETFYTSFSGPDNTQRMSRSLLQLHLDRAEQLILLHRFKAALLLLLPAADMFRRDAWFHLLQRALILIKIASCALALPSIYTTACFTLCSRSLRMTDEQRALAQNDLVEGITDDGSAHQEMPLIGEIIKWGQATNQVEADATFWATAVDEHGQKEATMEDAFASLVDNYEITTDAKPLINVLDTVEAAVECKVVLGKQDISTLKVPVTILLRSTAPMPLTLSHIQPTVVLRDEDGAEQAIQAAVAEGVLVLMPQATKAVTLVVTPPANARHDKCEMQLRYVTAAIKNKALLQWKLPLSERANPAMADKDSSGLTALPWSKVVSVSSKMVHCRHSGLQITFKHKETTLTDEEVVFGVILKNQRKSTPATSIELQLQLSTVSPQRKTQQQELTVSADGATHNSTGGKVSFPLSDLSGAKTVEVQVRTTVAYAATINLDALLTYSMAKIGACTMTSSTSVPCIAPITTHFTFITETDQRVGHSSSTAFPAGSRLTLQANLSTVSTSALRILRTFVRQEGNESQGEGQAEALVTGISTMSVTKQPSASKSGEVEGDGYIGDKMMLSNASCLSASAPFTELVDLTLPATTTDQSISLGYFGVVWQRCEETQADKCQTSLFVLPMVDVTPPQLSARISLEVDKLVLGEPCNLQLIITNHTQQLQELQLTVEQNEFALSGVLKSNVFRIAPRDAVSASGGLHVLRFVLIPKTRGEAKLPTFTLVNNRDAEELPIIGPQQAFVFQS
eukprot:m.61688 g.61688  ORF g.61688 m.61688 type:complete len:1205 (-) comp11877_c0_seq3:651-4265(-)